MELCSSSDLHFSSAEPEACARMQVCLRPLLQVARSPHGQPFNTSVSLLFDGVPCYTAVHGPKDATPSEELVAIAAASAAAAAAHTTHMSQGPHGHPGPAGQLAGQPGMASLQQEQQWRDSSIRARLGQADAEALNRLTRLQQSQPPQVGPYVHACSSVMAVMRSACPHALASRPGCGCACYSFKGHGVVCRTPLLGRGIAASGSPLVPNPPQTWTPPQRPWLCSCLLHQRCRRCEAKHPRP